MPKCYEINDFLIIDDELHKLRLMDFIFLPKYYEDINILKMTCLETIFSLILVYIAYLRETKTQGNIKYILEKSLKKVFRYNISIIFLIYILTISNKFLKIREIKYLGIGILSIYILIEVIKIYISVKDCKDKNKEKYRNENLIIVMNQTNFTFILSDYIINPLYIFNRYDNKKIFKSLIVNGKKHTFVLYDAIRNGLINISQYKNIAYIIIVNKHYYINNTTKEKFKEKIENIASKEKFMIYEHGKSSSQSTITLIEELKSKYTYKVKKELDLKSVLDISMLNPNVDELKIKADKLLKYIEDKESTLKMKETEKNQYLKYGLNLILESFNYIEYFYTSVKMSEYIIHYMGLKGILEEKILTSEERERFENATWRFFVKLNKTYSYTNKEKIKGIISEEEIGNSIKKLRNNMKKSKDSKPLENINTYEFRTSICQIIGDIRNTILAHGVVSQEIAEENINDLFNILCILVIEFEELNITIEEDEKIRNILPKDMLAIYRYLNKQFLYSNPVIEEKEIIYSECLNYETGKKKIIDAEICIDINQIASDVEIEKRLKRWK